MSTYKLIKEKDPENVFDVASVTHTIHTESLPELVEAFEYFLKGCGYSFEGKLDLTIEEEE